VLGTLASQNLPVKSNFQQRTGLEAITGKSNFDISEWMLIQLLDAMQGRQGTMAMLCKRTVARKVLSYAWQRNLLIGESAIYPIDARRHFNAAVEAVLLVVHFRKEQKSEPPQAILHSKLAADGPASIIGFEDGMVLADLPAYRTWKHLAGKSELKWRSGIKHDCSKVMELRRQGDGYLNGIGELVDLEETYLYPMLKSSEVAYGEAPVATRWMLVTQQSIGQETQEIQRHAPKTWNYLTDHASLLNRRRSSIYRKRPPFSIFGVGKYSFAPWKVAISGFYKRLSFVAIGPVNGRPVVLDDTSYSLPCHCQDQAKYLAELLNSPPARAFYRAFVFWDAKRPITVEVLQRLDLRRLAESTGSKARFETLFREE
jgi:hypothetical protein